MMDFRLMDVTQAVVFGAGHGIGLALVENLLRNQKVKKIYGTYRDRVQASDLFDLQKEFTERLILKELQPSSEKELTEFSEELKNGNFSPELIINSIGFLHNEIFSPEKSLSQFSKEYFLESLTINALITPLIAKHFETLLPSSTMSCFMSISAKVGSIEDNKLGGWYSYRASKAALNMLIKNISIEFQRRRKNCVVIAVHPGTTETKLSSPFTKNTSYKIHSPRETADNILGLITELNLSKTGSFLSWDHQEIPW